MIGSILRQVRRWQVLPGVAGGLLVVGVLAGPGAWAQVTATQPSASTTYTGCLGASSGNVYSVKQGGSPLATCKKTDKQIKLSAGDITAVTPGTGLVGGASKGAATLSLDPSYQGKTKQFENLDLPPPFEDSEFMGGFAMSLECETGGATLSAGAEGGAAGGVINAIDAVLNGDVHDVGEPVPQGQIEDIASGSGGTLQIVYASNDGTVYTANVTFFDPENGGPCQFDGSIVQGAT